MNLPAYLTAMALIVSSGSGESLFPVQHRDRTQTTLAHPAVALVDSLGRPVIESGAPVSALRTCGDCHDSDYIASNSYHTEVGELDRHAGGGTNPATGEFNCFICHLSAPDNEARIGALQGGEAAWSPTATLAGTGLAERSGDGWTYVASRFDRDGQPVNGLPVVSPTSDNCGLCHGLVHAGTTPLVPGYGDGERTTELTGQIFSPQRIHESAMNVAGKDTLTRPWDVHAERLLDCTSCHFSINDPAYAAPPDDRRPRHLEFDSRRQNIGEFLRRPSHHFATGYSAHSTGGDEYDGSMRRCEDCHDAGRTHRWLPYSDRHLSRVMCESCHIPRVHAPARRAADWTVLTHGGKPRVEYRGVRGERGDPAALVEGYRPLLAIRTVDRSTPRIGPVNVVATWYWVSGGERVPHEDLVRAFFAGASYHPDIVAAFDRDGDGSVGAAELVIDSDDTRDAVAARLEAVGVDAPHIGGELVPYGLHHSVAAGRWATRDCDACHAESSILAAPFTLAGVAPGGVLPTPVAGSGVSLAGTITTGDDGSVLLLPDVSDGGFYVLGHDRWGPGDIAGLAVIAAVALGVLIHGGMRYRYTRNRGESR